MMSVCYGRVISLNICYLSFIIVGEVFMLNDAPLLTHHLVSLSYFILMILFKIFLFIETRMTYAYYYICSNNLYIFLRSSIIPSY